MGEVVTFRRRRGETIRGACRGSLTEAVREVGDPCAVVIVVLGVDGEFSMRSVTDGRMKDFDRYSRAAAILDRERGRLLD